nr:MAG TPA: hypothetical protein [Caudoviricetes sp.]
MGFVARDYRKLFGIIRVSVCFSTNRASFKRL